MLNKNIYRFIYQFMNKNVKRLFFLIYNDTVLVVSTNLLNFLEQVKDQDIGFKASLSTLRTRFLDNNIFSHTEGKRIYWFQKIENDKE